MKKFLMEARCNKILAHKVFLPLIKSNLIVVVESLVCMSEAKLVVFMNYDSVEISLT